VVYHTERRRKHRENIRSHRKRPRNGILPCGPIPVCALRKRKEGPTRELPRFSGQEFTASHSLPLSFRASFPTPR
jgi:hypothetical protein